MGWRFGITDNGVVNNVIIIVIVQWHHLRWRRLKVGGFDIVGPEIRCVGGFH